jgi:hypothetical protein
MFTAPEPPTTGNMSSIPDLFGASFLINLPERVDRLKSARRQFSRVGWEVGSNRVRIFPALRYTEPAGFPSAPVRGCFHSHLECLRLAHADRASSVLIIEDDIALSTSLPMLTTSIKSWLAGEQWDFVYFGHELTGNIPRAHRDTSEADLRFEDWKHDLLTAHFYGIGGRILSRLIEHLVKISNGRKGDQETGPMPVDGAYNIFRRNNADVRTLVSHPRLGWQLPSRSDLTPHPLDRLVFLRPVNSFVRKFKRMRSLYRS